MDNTLRGLVGFRAGVEPQVLSQLLTDRFGPDAWIFVRRPHAAPDPTHFAPSHLADWVTWDEGEVFNTQQEIRWRQRATGLAVWWLGETDSDIPDGFDQVGHTWDLIRHTHLAPKQNANGLYLWGQYNDAMDTWIEVRVPRLREGKPGMDYPVTKPVNSPHTADRFVRIGHILYCAPNGAVQFTRLTEVR